MYTKYNEQNNRYEIFTTQVDSSYEEILTKDGKIVFPIGLKEQCDEDIKYSITYFKIIEAKAYLASTDFKMLPNYVPKADEDLDAIIVKRNETRELIRNHSA